MRPPAELGEVPWQSLTHAYGPAEDVPAQLRALYDGGEAAEEALWELYGNIHHQGSVYPASAPAVPFLAHAAWHLPVPRAELLMLLAALADHSPEDAASPHWPGSSVAGVCSELAAVLPALLPCLDDPEAPVRRAALRIVATVAGQLPDAERAAALGRVAALCGDDPVPLVRADALTLLGRAGPEGAALLPLEPFGSALPEVRFAAAVLAAERAEPPYAAEVTAVLAADGPGPHGADSEEFPWPGIESPLNHLDEVILRDPVATRAIAARWIAAGDTGSRGCWLARQLTETWRDQEAVAVELLAAALPQQSDDQAGGRVLEDIAARISQVEAPPAELRETLHHFAAGREETAEPALLALLRCRDPRALELALLHPEPRILHAATAAFPEAADRLIPAIRSELAAGAADGGGIALITALELFGPAARAAEPELLDCLRSGRAAVAAARQLGLQPGAAPEAVAALRGAADQRADAVLSATAAVSVTRLTGDQEPLLRAFEGLLTEHPRTPSCLTALGSLGSAAAPLLREVEPLLSAGATWTRAVAAETHHRITGSAEPAASVLAGMVSASPVGLRALKALASIGTAPDALRPVLRTFADSPRRQIADAPFTEHGQSDRELRAAAASLCAGAPGTA